MTKKLFAFDVDGTFLNDEKKVLTSTIKSLKKLKENEHYVVFATGRVPALTFDIIEDNYLDFDFVIGLNGASIFDCKTNTYDVYSTPVPEDIIKRLIAIARKARYDLILSDGINTFQYTFSNRHDTHGKYWHTNKPLNKNVITNDMDQLENLQKNTVHFSIRIQEELVADVLKEFKNKAEFSIHKTTPKSVGVLDVNPKGVSKSYGIKKLIEKLKLQNKDVYCFGDSYNDLSMLITFDNSIAMGNANSEIKAKAKYVTDDNNSDGIFNFLKKQNLI